MNSRSAALPALLLPLALLVSCTKDGSPGAGAKVTLDTDEQKTLYALGLSIGRNISVFDLSTENLAIVQKGMADQVSGRPAQVKLEEWGPKIQELARAREGRRAEGEKKKGAEFLAKAEKEPGVKKLPSGVLYHETLAGSGQQPKASDVVKVHYRGTLADGTEFDSSFKRNEPAQFPLQGVIPCWTEGLQQMKVGGKAKLVCPPDKAYGDRGSPPNIPGGATLVFEVELLELVNPSNQPGLPPGHGPHDGHQH